MRWANRLCDFRDFCDFEDFEVEVDPSVNDENGFEWDAPVPLPEDEDEDEDGSWLYLSKTALWILPKMGSLFAYK